jgi:DNA (cytosine-5)-methyltransferase 1
MKILNLYAGIGGNRKLWEGDIEVTAIENNPKIAEIYKELYPDDEVIVTDAHQYLLEHFTEFDFIWSSPPCPTHSRLNYPMFKKGKYRYANMDLYQEIILLTWCFKGKFVVENVISYYHPLIKPQLIGRHYYWSNFNIGKTKYKINDDIANGTFEEMSKYHDINLDKFNIGNKRLLLRNCVNPQHGLHIFNMAFNDPQLKL